MSVGGQIMTVKVKHNHVGNSPLNLLIMGQAGGQVAEQWEVVRGVG